MRVGLIDVDSHNFPNLCLMKLSEYHTRRGDRVEWWNPAKQYDLVYKSRVFTDTYHNNFNPELRKYMRRAGITVPKEGHAGVHTFRHSFATILLKDEASLQDISQILGHSDINVTETYLRVDIEQLRLCSLDLEVL